MKGNLRIVVGCCLCFVGAAAFLHPKFEEWKAERAAQEIIAQLESEYLHEAENVDSQSGESTDGTANKIYDGSAVGYIEIPTIGCVLPLYIGATTENLSLGAAVLENTSMPIGGKSENCVIAAHRSDGFFRDINSMEVGDLVYITNAWQTLIYQAVSMEVVHQTDESVLKIVEGEDRVTLVSCEPYGANHPPYRYIVHCVRVGTVDDGELITKGAENKDVEAVITKEVKAKDGVSGITETIDESEKLILIEDVLRSWVPPALITLAAALIIKTAVLSKCSKVSK